MGTFDTGIMESDLSMDVKSYYDEFLEECKNNHAEAYKKLIKQYKGELCDFMPSEKADFWFAVAEIQMSNGLLNSEVKEKCLKLLANKKIFEMWGEEEEVFEERIKVLAEFTKRLKSF